MHHLFIVFRLTKFKSEGVGGGLCFHVARIGEWALNWAKHTFQTNATKFKKVFDQKVTHSQPINNSVPQWNSNHVTYCQLKTDKFDCSIIINIDSLTDTCPHFLSANFIMENCYLLYFCQLNMIECSPYMFMIEIALDTFMHLLSVRIKRKVHLFQGIMLFWCWLYIDIMYGFQLR